MSADRRTLGELVGRLADLTIKLYMVQNEVHDAARRGAPLSAVATGNVVKLNLQRNEAMTAIDTILDEAVRSGQAQIDPRIKLP